MTQDIGAPASASPVVITAVNGKQFVSGLFWQPLTKPRAYMKEAREIGKREGMDIVAIRHSTIMQAGFVAKNQGVLKGMYSMAAALAGRLGNSWIGVFKLDGGSYYLGAVIDGAIVPGSDMVGTREQVREKLNYIYGYSKWEAVYAPADFDYGGKAVDIKTLLLPGDLKKEHQLKQLTFGLTKREIAIAGLILVSIAAGAIAVTQWKVARERRLREERIRAEQIRQQQLEELNARAKQQQSVKALDHPWSKAPAAVDFVVGCEEAINRAPLVRGGWAFISATCDGLTVASTYKHSGNATVNDLVDEVREQDDVVPTTSDFWQTGVVTVGIKVAYGGDDVLQPTPERVADFMSHFYALGIEPKLAEKKVVAVGGPPTMPGQPGAPASAVAAPLPDWKETTFSFDTELAPKTAFKAFEGNGVRLTTLSVKLDEAAKLTWTVSGEIYAK